MSWIDCKVRKPTAEDGDKNGCVLVQTGNGSRAVMKICAMNNNDVAWMPIDAFVPLPLPEPPAGYRILADRSLPWHPATKHWVSRISEWQTSGGHHKREYIGDDIYAVPIEPPEPPEGYRLVTDYDEPPRPDAMYWLPTGGENKWTHRLSIMAGKQYIRTYAYAVPIKPLRPPEGFRIVDTATEPFNAMAMYYSQTCSEWQQTLNEEFYGSGIVYAVPIDPPEPQYRPFANADEFRPYRHRWFRLKTETEAKTEYPPRAFNDKSYSHFSWADALETLVFACGHPFGVRVDDTK